LADLRKYINNNRRIAFSFLSVSRMANDSEIPITPYFNYDLQLNIGTGAIQIKVRHKTVK